MAHRTLKQGSFDYRGNGVAPGYEKLSKRLNRFPQGAYESKLLFEILAMLFSENEAALVSQLPIKPFTAKQAAAIWKTDITAARKTLDTLADRAILLDMEIHGETSYTLPPPMAGFFEFSMMRYRGDIDQKELGKLFYQYMNVEEEFVRSLFTDGETQLGRVFVNEPALAESFDSGSDGMLTVLDHERATEVIKSASHIGVGVCYCRHKMQHVGRNCDAPLEICMTFNTSAASLTKHGFARKIDSAECLDLLEEAYAHNLVQFGENVRRRVNFICNCCGCCCEAMIAARKFGLLNPIHTTNYLPRVAYDACTGCGKCVAACPVEAMTLISANDPHNGTKKKAKLDERICLGCAVCVRTCGTKALTLVRRTETVITPLDSVHKTVMMAVERGKLENLIFDNRAYLSHRMMAAILGVILRLPPFKQILASRQVKSRYFERVISWYNAREAKREGKREAKKERGR